LWLPSDFTFRVRISKIFVRSLRARYEREGFGLAAFVCRWKEREPIYSVPIKGDGEIARSSRRVNRLFEKILKFFPGSPAGRISKFVG
jgi:hypothetical protein